MKIDESLKTMGEAWAVTRRHGLGEPLAGCWELASVLLGLERKVATLEAQLAALPAPKFKVGDVANTALSGKPVEIAEVKPAVAYIYRITYKDGDSSGIWWEEKFLHAPASGEKGGTP